MTPGDTTANSEESIMETRSESERKEKYKESGDVGERNREASIESV